MLANQLHVVPDDQFQPRTARDLPQIARRYGLRAELLESVATAARVLPFRTNDYVLDRLVDWSSAPDDPIFQLVFPQEEMLPADVVAGVRDALARGGTDGDALLDQVVERARRQMNPHPGGQLELNVPTVDGARLEGVQHKYAETVLYFPANGQTCHAYCTYCFRWAQFTGGSSPRFAARGPGPLVEYLRNRPEVTDVLLTGGDPMVMSAERLARHLLPLLEVPTVETVRIGTKSIGYWPGRFTTDPDAAALLSVLRRVVESGRTLAVMLHVSHPRELATPDAEAALAQLHGVGARLYGQAPLIAHVNDEASVWTELWRAEHRAGIVPYYMFVERDTGPREYFEVPLRRAREVFVEAVRRLPGLARTVRGPVMSATPGKVLVGGDVDLEGQRWTTCELVQARNPELVGRPFLAQFDDQARWLDDLALHPATPSDLVGALRPAP